MQQRSASISASDPLIVRCLSGMHIKNLTPHPIVLRTANGDNTLAPSGTVARVATLPQTEERIEGIAVPIASAPSFGPVEGLPDPEEGTVFVVSLLVAQRVAGRQDVFSPGTGPNDKPVRNEAGQVVAVTRLVRA